MILELALPCQFGIWARAAQFRHLKTFPNFLCSGLVEEGSVSGFHDPRLIKFAFTIHEDYLVALLQVLDGLVDGYPLMALANNGADICCLNCHPDVSGVWFPTWMES